MNKWHSVFTEQYYVGRTREKDILNKKYFRYSTNTEYKYSNTI